MATSKTPAARRPGHPRTIATRVREAQALQLRANGTTITAIAETLGITHQAATQAIARALNRIPDPEVAVYRKIQVEQILESYQIASRIALSPPPILDKRVSRSPPPPGP